MRSLAEQLREAARAALPEGAFLRRDRGEALFVSDAPRLRPPADWLPALERADFLCEVSGGLCSESTSSVFDEKCKHFPPNPPSQGSTGPFSLKNVHWTFFQALEPPKGKAMGSASKSLPLWGRWPAVGGSDEVDVQQRKVNDVALGGLLYLTPGPAWLADLEARFPEPPDPFSATLARFRGMAPETESLALFALAIRRMDGEADGGRFERRLRQRAAECLRLTAADKTTTPGGGLYACALARYMTMEAIP